MWLASTLGDLVKEFTTNNVGGPHLISGTLKSKIGGFPEKKEFCLKTVAQKSCPSF